MNTLRTLTEEKVVFDEEKLLVTKKCDEKSSSKRPDSAPAVSSGVASLAKFESTLLSAQFYRLGPRFCKNIFDEKYFPLVERLS